MYTLFFSPGACSKAVHLALNECGADYETVYVDLHGSTPNAQLKAVNPRHNVPVLKDDDFVIREGAAILIYLLEKENSALLPKSGEERGRALEWLAWCNATLHPAYSRVFSVGRVSSDASVQQAITTYSQKHIQGLWDDVNAHLENNQYLAGDQLTVADLLMTVIAQWQPDSLKGAIKPGSNVERVVNAVKARPSWQAVSDFETSAKQQAA